MYSKDLFFYFTHTVKCDGVRVNGVLEIAVSLLIAMESFYPSGLTPAQGEV